MNSGGMFDDDGSSVANQGLGELVYYCLGVTNHRLHLRGCVKRQDISTFEAPKPVYVSQVLVSAS